MEHSFDIDIAVKVGVNAAVIYNNILHWVAWNKANELNYKCGHYWSYNSMKAFAELFPYMTEKQIRGAVDKLKDEGLIKVGHFNTDKRNRTNWYTITSEKAIASAQKGKTELPLKSDASALKGECTINYNKTTNINTNINDISACADEPNTRSGDVKIVRHKYGEYRNVLLSDPELEKLQHEFPTDWEGRIEKLSAYMASTGKVYKNHLATIRNWNRMEQERSQPKQGDGWDHLDQLAAEGRL